MCIGVIFFINIRYCSSGTRPNALPTCCSLKSLYWSVRQNLGSFKHVLKIRTHKAVGIRNWSPGSIPDQRVSKVRYHGLEMQKDCRKSNIHVGNLTFTNQIRPLSTIHYLRVQMHSLLYYSVKYASFTNDSPK